MSGNKCEVFRSRSVGANQDVQLLGSVVRACVNANEKASSGGSRECTHSSGVRRDGQGIGGQTPGATTLGQRRVWLGGRSGVNNGVGVIILQEIKKHGRAI